MGRRLTGYVPVHGDGETVTWYGPDDTVPAKHAKLIGDHAWVDDESVEDDASDQGPTPPPKSGAGSGAEAWALYAAELDVEVPADAGRDQIVEAIRAAGHPVEQPAS